MAHHGGGGGGGPDPEGGKPESDRQGLSLGGPRSTSTTTTTTNQGRGYRHSTNHKSATVKDTTGVGAQRLRTSPDNRTRRRTSSGNLVSVPEDAVADHSSPHQFGRTTSSPQMVPQYGNYSPPRYVGGANLNGEPDDDEYDNEDIEEWLIDEELAREGLYRGSYKRILTLYSLTPLCTVLTFTFLAVFPIWAYPLDPSSPHTKHPYAPYFPFPFPELLTAAALWALSHLLRDFISSLVPASTGKRPHYITLLPTVLTTTLSIVLQLAAIVLLLITPLTKDPHAHHRAVSWHDHAFRRVWAIALGWAGMEALVGIKQGYENVALYRDVLVTVRRISSPEATPTAGGGYGGTSFGERSAISLNTTASQHQQYRRRDDTDEDDDDDLLTPRNEHQPLLPRAAPSLPQLQTAPHSPQSGKRPESHRDAAEEVENDLDQLLALKSREELEEVYGMPLIYIPVFIPPLHRINAALHALGNFLLLSGAYLRSSFAPGWPYPLPPPPPPPPSSPIPASLLTNALAAFLKPNTTTTNPDTLLLFTILFVLLAELCLAMLHTSAVLPRIGVHTFVYVSLLVALGMFFAGLGAWGALV